MSFVLRSTLNWNFAFKCNTLVSLSKCDVNLISGVNVRNNQSLFFSRGHKRYVRHLKSAFKAKKDELEFKNMGPLPPQPRNTYPEWNYNAELFAFGKRLGEDFQKEILQQAFVERSYIIQEEERQKKVGIEEPDIKIRDNVEFVVKGEKLAANYINRYLRTVFPRYPEEGICAVTGYLLSDDVLADISKNLGTSDLILTSDHPPTVKTLSNVLKSVIHALELSSGGERACLFIRDFIISYLSGKNINDLWEIKDPEKVLSLILKRDGRHAVEARLIGEAGKNTILAAFQVGLYSNKELIGKGFGESITVAREMAALDALKRLFYTTERAKPIPFDLEISSSKSEPFANLSIQDWCEKNVNNLVTQR